MLMKIDEYREAVEGNMYDFLTLLKNRSSLLKRYPKDRMILGGDKYLKKSIGEVSGSINDNSQQEYTLKNAPEELIKWFDKTAAEWDKEIEEVISALVDLYNMKALMYITWSEKGVIYFVEG